MSAGFSRAVAAPRYRLGYWCWDNRFRLERRSAEQSHAQLLVTHTGPHSTSGTQWFFTTKAATGGLTTRTAEREGAFFLPYLRPGMRLLDVGCGPGSITVGMAAAVAPGDAVGVDLEAGLVEQARALAAEKAVTNVRFEQADLYALPFPDATFDAAFLNAVLEHMPNPITALQAIRRVVRPGGVIGVRSPDINASIVEPPDPVLLESLVLIARLRDAGVGHAGIGRTLRALLLEAGLINVVMTMSMQSHGTLEGTRAWADIASSYFGSSTVVDQVVRLGLADQANLSQMSAAWRAWSERPDALYAAPYGEAVGWVQ